MRVRNMSTQFASWIQATAAASGIFVPGDIFFLVPATGATAQFINWLQANGVPESHYGTSLATMYARMTEGRNDILFVLPGNHPVTSAQTWDKRYSHVIGTHNGAMNQRSRITCATNAVSPMITISDEGSLYKNILFSQEASNAGNEIPVYVTGHRPVFENCGFRNIGALAVVDSDHRSLKIGSCYDITFRNCQIGETSYDAGSASSKVIEFSGTDAGKYLFYNCLILGAGAAGAVFFAMPANVGGFTLFKDCLFHNSTISGLDAMTQAFSISGTGNDGVYLIDCMVNGVACYETDDSGVLFGRNAYAAATTDLALALTY